jgi:hypothetical protein
MPAVVRIVPKVPFGGIPAAAMALGCGASVLFVEYAEPWLMNLVVRPGSSMLLQVLSGVLPALVPPVVLCLVVCRFTRKFWPAVLAPVGWMMGTALGAALVGLNHNPAALAASEFWYAWLVPAAVVVIAGLLIGSLTRWLAGYARRPVVQAGTRCWRCAHDLGANPAPVCPECATPFDTARFRRRGLARCIRVTSRAGWALGAVVVVVTVLFVGRTFRDVGLPAMRFVERMGMEGHTASQWVYIAPKTMTAYNWDGIVVMHPAREALVDPEQQGWKIAYAYWPRGPAGGPADVRMRVFLAADGSVPDLQNFPEEGSVRICCDLNARQAEHVMQVGKAPPTLLHALVQAGRDQGWQPNGNTFGPNYQAKHVSIDPEEHFRPAESQ